MSDIAKLSGLYQEPQGPPKTVGYTPTLNAWEKIFAMLRADGHSVPLGVIVDESTARAMWSELASISWGDVGPFQQRGELHVYGVRFRWQA